MTSHKWQPSVFLSGDIAEKVAQIKGQQRPDLHVWGSGHLIQTLMKHDPVDMFRLMIYPITLGIGKRLFANGTIPAAFKVTDSNVTSNGVIVVNYEGIMSFSQRDTPYLRSVQVPPSGRCDQISR
jgi:dihydrofolate reductase